jgi:hypothetical protein
VSTPNRTDLEQERAALEQCIGHLESTLEQLDRLAEESTWAGVLDDLLSRTTAYLELVEARIIIATPQKELAARQALDYLDWREVDGEWRLVER